MKKHSFKALALALLAGWANAAVGQVDCTAPSGILAMQLAKMVAAYSDPDDSQNNEAICRLSTEIFKTPQPDALRCADRIETRLYYATSRDALNALPDLAAKADWTALAQVASVQARRNTPSLANRAGAVGSIGREKPQAIVGAATLAPQNILHFEAVVPPSTARCGARVFYRWAKVIDHPTDVDPYIWSPVLEFEMRPCPPPAPPAGAQPDLAVVGMKHPLYAPLGGTVGDGIYTYHALNEAFCQSLPQGGFVQEATLQNMGNASGTPILRLNYQMPNQVFAIQNIGNAPTGNGFTVKVFEGSRTSGGALLNQTFLPFAPNQTDTVTIIGRASAVVYRFPGFDGDDTRYCYVREELNHNFPKTLERDGFRVTVDTDNAVANERSEQNNSTYFNASSRVGF